MSDTLFEMEVPHRLDDEILEAVEAAILSKYECPATIRAIGQKVFFDTGVRYHLSTILSRVKRLVAQERVYAEKGLVTNPHKGEGRTKGLSAYKIRPASTRILVYGPWTNKYKENIHAERTG